MAVANMFPMAHQPFLQFLSLPAKKLRERIAEITKLEQMWTFTFVPDGEGDKGTACEDGEKWYLDDWETRGRGRVKVSGPSGWKWRCKWVRDCNADDSNTLHLILPILPRLPDEFFTQDPPLQMVFNADDGPRGQVQ